MNIQQIKIGYSPYSPNCQGPGDRRRLMFYSNERKLNVEIADVSKIYDLVYITSSANITKWITYKKNNPRVKLVFEIIDSYLLEETSFALYLKGLSRLLTGRESRLYIDYRNAFINIIKVADAVVCSTSIQRENILKYNQNVHVSLDYFLNDITHKKTNYEGGSKLKIGWEGMAYTVDGLLELNAVFKEFAGRVELHVITDPEVKYPLKILNKKTTSLLSALNCEWHFHRWSKDNFSQLMSEMDIAVIPINMSNKLTFNKPENKLLLLWEIGIPVLVSGTPAYSRVMKTAGLDASCSSNKEWQEKIDRLFSEGADGREAYMKKANQYLANNHAKEKILSKWDEIFQSVL